MSALVSNNRSGSDQAAICDLATTDLAPGLEHDDRQQRGQNVGAGRDEEHRVPAARRLLHVVRHRHQQRRGALRRVEQAGIGGRELGAEGVGAGRREQGVDLTPGEEHEARQQHEPDRIVAQHVEPPDADAFHAEGDEHGVLAADHVGDPAEEGTGQAVEDAIDGGCEGHRRHGHAISVTGTLSTFQSTAIGLRLAVTIRPPAPTITNMKYISQKIG